MSFWKNYDWKKDLKLTALIFLFGSLSIFVWCFGCYDTSTEITVSMIFSGLMWVLLWQGNGLVSNYISYHYSWLENPTKRFIIGTVGVIIYTPAAVFGLYFLGNLLFNINMNGIITTVLISIGITFVISFFMNAAEFLRNWKKAALDTEKLKKEQMASKYESLKNQVNPHFLFNSLNALTNLVYEDQDMAADFIRKLSKVYRYVLDNQSKEVVPLETELAFVNSYLFLQRIRFDDKLKVNIDVKGYEKTMIPPIALQMLFENAIKHNTIAEEEPLTIDVYVENEKMLVIKNNLQKKNIPIEESAGVGLKNVQARFEFLSQTKVDIIETDTEFIVKLPLLSFTS